MSRCPDVIVLDIGPHALSGTATRRRFAKGFNEVVVGYGAATNGQITFNLPARSILPAIVRSPGGNSTTPRGIC